jgi:hypothetical protein
MPEVLYCWLRLMKHISSSSSICLARRMQKEAILIRLISVTKRGILTLPLAIECYKFILHYDEKAGHLDIS